MGCDQTHLVWTQALVFLAPPINRFQLPQSSVQIVLQRSLDFLVLSPLLSTYT